jgi:hypothetical protein
MLGSMAMNRSGPAAAAPMTTADEITVTMETLRELGGGHTDAVVASFVSRLGDQIDDRVAEALDEQLAEHGRVRPGSAGLAAARDGRAGLTVVLAAMLLGSVTTVLAGGFAVAAFAWVGMAVINVTYFSRTN